MNRTTTAAAAVLIAAAPLAWGASSTSSAVSDSLTTSSGSVSDSLRGSSRASSPDDRRAATGDWRIVAVTAVPERPGRVRLALRRDGSSDDAGFALELPQPVLRAAALAVGDVVSARQRPYGVEFAVAATRQPFFLVLDDDWQRELQARPLKL